MEKVINRLKPKSEFTKNVLTLMTGTSIAQALPIAISPILTRLYTPEDFGVFALFVAITSTLGSIANGRYELAIMLPKKDEDAINIFALGFIINIALFLFLLLIVIIFHDYIVKLLNNKEISPWLYFIPFSVFLMGCFNLLNYFNNRLKNYKDLAKANVYKSIGMAVVQLGLGFLKAGVLGLISGQIFSQIISNTKLFFYIKKLNLFNKIKKIKIISLGKKYKDFLFFSSLEVLANTLGYNIKRILISVFFDIKTLGFYSLTERVLNVPSNLIASSISQVFFQKVTEEKNQTGKGIKTYIYTLKYLLLFSIPIYIFLYVFIDKIFVFIFGEKWYIAGLYSKILIPFYFINFVSGALSIILSTFEKIRQGLIINLIIFITIIALFFYLKDVPFIFFLKWLSFLLSLEYTLFLYYYYLVAKRGIKK